MKRRNFPISFDYEEDYIWEAIEMKVNKEILKNQQKNIYINYMIE